VGEGICNYTVNSFVGNINHEFKMKLLPTLFALTLLPQLAFAVCEKPVKPIFPDPKTASAEQVQKLDAAMQAYAKGVNDYVGCQTQLASQVQAEGKDTIMAYNQKFLAVYNKRAAAGGAPVQ
jgi:hypothetical protein